MVDVTRDINRTEIENAIKVIEKLQQILPEKFAMALEQIIADLTEIKKLVSVTPRVKDIETEEIPVKEQKHVREQESEREVKQRDNEKDFEFRKDEVVERRKEVKRQIEDEEEEDEEEEVEVEDIEKDRVIKLSKSELKRLKEKMFED